MKKNALITGITGQDGSYLAEFLLQKNYTVHGLVKEDCPLKTNNIDHIKDKLTIHYGDITHREYIQKLIKDIAPDEIYNLAAQTHVLHSFEKPDETNKVNILGPKNILKSIISNSLENKTRFYQASTSELFGNSTETAQKETTPFQPVSPYGISKLKAFQEVVNYRNNYNVHVSNGILFNHESPRRGNIFVSRKITQAAVRISLGLQDKLYLGNLEAKRDWGFAPEYVEAMWLILQQNTPDDYVIATGESYSVRKFVEESFKILDIEIKWQGSGLNEKGIDKSSGKTIIEINEEYFRPIEINSLSGDYSKAKKILFWKPKTKFHKLINLMINEDIKLAKNTANVPS